MVGCRVLRCARERLVTPKPRSKRLPPPMVPKKNHKKTGAQGYVREHDAVLCRFGDIVHLDAADYRQEPVQKDPVLVADLVGIVPGKVIELQHKRVGIG
jgi:hypothetical protein